MKIGELAARTGATRKAVRYYERLGLLEPHRMPNGYRDYDEGHVRVVTEIRELTATGIAAKHAAPFVECLGLGHGHGDDCVSSLAVHRDAIAEIDRLVATLHVRRARLEERLATSASRTFPSTTHITDHSALPPNLPVPVDDGAADHLTGVMMPAVMLATSDGSNVRMDALGVGRTVIYVYPLAGRPGSDPPEGWDSIPGARGCTAEACDLRDHHDELRRAGVTAVYGPSSQDVGYQAEVVARLRLPFTMLSDGQLQLAEVLKLPTFDAPGTARLYSRLTLIVRAGRIEHVFYPIFPPDTHAQQVLTWLAQNPT